MPMGVVFLAADLLEYSIEIEFALYGIDDHAA